MVTIAPRLVAGLFVVGVWALLPAPWTRSAAAPLPGINDGWQYLQSPNFELYSQNGAAESRELLHHLELLHAVFVERFKLTQRRRQPVSVFSFASLKVFRRYTPAAVAGMGHIGGYYRAGLDRASIVVGPGEAWSAARTMIFHEYVHHLVRVSEEQPPVWLDEGLADLLATLVVNGASIEFGRPSASRVRDLQGGRFFPLEQLFAVDRTSAIYREADQACLFYAQSWLLLHYWYFGESNIAEDAVTAFLREARRQPALPPPALRQRFKEAFGVDYPEMQQQLERYMRSGRFRWSKLPIPIVPPPESYSVSRLTADEIRPRLAALALWVNRSPEARAVLLDAAAGSAPDIRAWEILGADSLRGNDPVQARVCWEKAIAAGSTNPAVYRELGVVESRAWFQHFDCDLQQAEAVTERLRALFTRSIEYSPDQTAGYEALAWTEAYAARPSGRNVNLVQARLERLGDSRRTLLALALIRHRFGDRTTALQMLDQLDRAEADRWTMEGAAVLRSKITGEPVENRVR